jgi:hypothetical protein
MANNFSKEEVVAFENILEGFNDALILSKNITIYNTNGVTMERARDTIWRPQPYIAQSFSRTVGTPITSSIQQMTQLSVPSTLGFSQCSAWQMDALELRDALQEGRLGDAAKQKLASDINLSVMDVASAQGTLVVPIGTVAGDYDDIALCDSIMNEQGIMASDRYLALSSRDYNGMAGNLAVATRSFTGTKSAAAYERSYVGPVAGFETYKLDYANRCAANTATVEIDTTDTTITCYVPQATTNTVGGVLNVDNRYQTVAVDTTVGVTEGDAFTIDGVEAVHHITKRSTGELKTFRVIQVVDATTLVISPPIISASSTPTDAELQYKNVELVSTSATASVNFLNIKAANINPFWRKDAIELLPGRYAVPNAGVDVMRASTDQGIELVMTKKFDPLTFQTLYTLDTLYGVVMTNPEMAGILLFDQQ